MEKEDRVFIAIWGGFVRLIKIFIWIIRNLFNMGMYAHQRWEAAHPKEYAPPIETKLEHTHIVAGSGHGKTQLLQNLIMRSLDSVKAGK